MDAAASVPLGAGSAAMAFDEDPPRVRAEDRGAAPVLRLSAFEGRLDWLLELARERRVDLARLSLVEVADQLIAALERSAGERDSGDDRGAIALLRRGEWVVMGAALAELRTRLLLPEGSAAGRQACEEASALRERLVERARVLAAADWLDRRPQLGRDVFGGGAPELGTTRGRTADLTALLRACLTALQAEIARGERYRPRPPPLWRMQDAMARIARLLPTVLGATGDADGGGTSLWSFLPDAECLASSAGLAGEEVRDPALLARSAVAGTFVAGLELARQGHLMLGQEDGFGSIRVSAGLDSATATRGDDGAGARET